LGETLLEAASVAAPIRDPNGRAVAGVSVAVPVDQLQDAGLNRYVDLVQLGARAISRRLAMVELPTRTRRSPM
jgi:DNA-binding IclR family transcriptional regulator